MAGADSRALVTKKRNRSLRIGPSAAGTSGGSRWHVARRSAVRTAGPGRSAQRRRRQGACREVDARNDATQQPLACRALPQPRIASGRRRPRARRRPNGWSRPFSDTHCPKRPPLSSRLCGPLATGQVGLRWRGTSTATPCMNLSGDITKCRVPSSHGVFSFSTAGTAASYCPGPAAPRSQTPSSIRHCRWMFRLAADLKY